jgi:hypothetical protein
MKFAAGMIGISAIYAFLLFAHTELWVNEYRIQRLFGLHHPGLITNLCILSFYIVFTPAASWFTKRLPGASKWKYGLCVSWIPIYWILIRQFALHVPLTNPQDQPLPAAGLMLLGWACCYPLFILFVTFLSSEDGG